MTTREAMHRLLDEMSDEEIEALARTAREQGLADIPDELARQEPARCIDARQYPALAAVWDNDDDAIFDDL